MAIAHWRPLTHGNRSSTASDAGGVLELVTNEMNGLVAPADPRALADAMDRLFLDRGHTARMGEANNRRLSELGINWETVIEFLTS